MEKESQNKRIKEYLQKGKTITPLEALCLFGCWALSSRISDLRREGLKIKSELIDITSDGKIKHVSRYSIAKVMVHPNIFRPRNDWSITTLKSKKLQPENTVEGIVCNSIREVTGLNPKQNTSTRKREIVQNRQLFLTLMMRHTGMTLAAVGSIVKQDHSTVLHAIKTIDNIRDTDKEFRNTYEIIDAKIKLKLKNL